MKKLVLGFFKAVMVVLLLVLAAVCLPLIILEVSMNFMRSVQLCTLVRLHWHPEKKHLLFVYSNSPNWKEYVEAHLLPKICPSAVVLNWSEKAQWDLTRKPLAVRVFEHWAGMSVDRWRGKLQWGESGSLAASLLGEDTSITRLPLCSSPGGNPPSLSSGKHSRTTSTAMIGDFGKQNHNCSPCSLEPSRNAMDRFQLVTDLTPKGDQPPAIEAFTKGGLEGRAG